MAEILKTTEQILPKDKSHHKKNSLLFQFILIQFIEAQTEMQRLELLCNRRESPLSFDKTPVHNQIQTKEQIKQILHKLVGSARDYMKLFSWNFGDGILAKLKANCIKLIENAPDDEKELFALQHYADKMILWCLQALNQLEDNQQQEAPLFLVSIDKAASAMQRFSKQLAQLALEFKEDENVLLCLLRYKESLEKLFGSRFVPKLFLKMFPKGLKEAESFIIARYLKRGFQEVTSIVSVKIAELEATLS